MGQTVPAQISSTNLVTERNYQRKLHKLWNALWDKPEINQGYCFAITTKIRSKGSPSSWGTNKASVDACNEVSWAAWPWHSNEEQEQTFQVKWAACEHTCAWTWTCSPFIVGISHKSKIKAQVHLGKDSKQHLNLHKHLPWRQVKQDSSWVFKSSLPECVDTAVILYSPLPAYLCCQYEAADEL